MLKNISMHRSEVKERNALWFAIGEITLILLLWVLSLDISRPIFDRPLGAHHEWNTAHSLVSLRAFEERGLWDLQGVSVEIPNSYELRDADLHNLKKADGVYISFPSLWLIEPSIVFHTLKAVWPELQLSPAFLEAYNLVTCRLLGGIVIYYLFLEIIGIFGGQTLMDSLRGRMYAGLGVTGWMLSPAVLYWTQNVYFADQAVLFPLYLLFLLSLRLRFRLEEMSLPVKLIVFGAVFLACGADWYGWLGSSLVVGLGVTEYILASRSSQLKVPFTKLAERIIWPLAGMVMAGILFASQIARYSGFSDLLDVFKKRAIGGSVTEGESIVGLPQMLLRILHYWHQYLPSPLNLLSGRERYIFLVEGGLAIALAALAFYLARQLRRSEPMGAIGAIVLLYIAPLLQITLLLSHAFIHDFASLKIGLPIIFSLFVVPLLVFESWLSKRQEQRTLQRFFPEAVLAAVLLTLIVVTSNSVTLFAMEPTGTQNVEIGELIRQNISDLELPIADPNGEKYLMYPSQSLTIGPSPPIALWYAGRFVYSTRETERLVWSVKDLLQKGNVPHLRKMRPVFLAFADQAHHSSASKLCEGHWQRARQSVAGRSVVFCRELSLKRLIN
jgi:hypothetical protein